MIFTNSGVDTGSGGSMNRGPRAPGGPERRATKIICKKIISLLAYTSGSGKQTTNYKSTDCMKMFAKMPTDRLKMHQKAFGGRAPPEPAGGA